MSCKYSEICRILHGVHCEDSDPSCAWFSKLSQLEDEHKKKETITISRKEYEKLRRQVDYLWSLEMKRTEDAIQKIQSQCTCSCADGSMGKKTPEQTIEKVLKDLSDIHQIGGVEQSVYVIEECSELIKALTKESRGKGSEKDILEEACDVIGTVFGLLMDRGVSREYVKDQILYKCNRAIERYHTKKEL